VLWRIFGPKKGELTGGWTNFIMRSIIKLFSSPNIIRSY